MKRRILMAAVAAEALTLSGCGANDLMASPEELSCLDAIRSTLINPETASFHDFQKMGEQDGKAMYGVRVRAEGKLGNTITQNYGCMENDEYGMIAIAI
ncbi:hypothetical protein [Erythrobacter sanguineus]|jgi:hypothetical protein|uniref:Peptidase inhibitor I78 family protein n=1 Tax=Erythrobacter sanguineus TaxID=198312 RepID=A0A1M7T3Q1_9SPHN|nr:hypothetical protein [Erythrobacter sanguineus]SHN65380.1 hypothetical protein SAMN02745193_02863 [Erythrobacter sanguineus]